MLELTNNCLLSLHFASGDVKHLFGLDSVKVNRLKDGSITVEVCQHLGIGDECYPWGSKKPCEVTIKFLDKIANRQHTYALKSPDFGVFSESYANLSGTLMSFSIESRNWELNSGPYHG